MDIKELEKIKLKDDGKQGERFQQALKKVVNVPKEQIKKTKSEPKLGAA